MDNIATVKAKYRVFSGRLDESTRRIWSAMEAQSLGKGIAATVAKAIRISRTMIYADYCSFCFSEPPKCFIKNRLAIFLVV